MGKVAIVVDNGSAFSRSGFAGEEKPRISMKTTYLPPTDPGMTQDKHLSISCSVHAKDSSRRSPDHPVRHGIIVDWEAMENLWSHLFYCGLRVPVEDHPMLMSDSPSCPTTNREKMAEVFFESFGVPALHVANTGFLSLCACGRVTGLSVEAGAGVSHVTPIYSGQTWMEGTYRLDVAGRALCKHMHTLLLESSNDPQLLESLDKKLVAWLTKQYCYVSMDYERDLQGKACQDPVSVQIPDGHLLKLDKERICCPEPLFRPHLLSQNSPGLHILAFQSLQKFPAEFQGELMHNVVLSGGSSLFPGFPERMCKELHTLLHGRGHPIKILASPARGKAAWLGGSLVASLSSFSGFWMNKEDYQEHGAAYVHEKFK